jgi:hypothetical protein
LGFRPDIVKLQLEIMYQVVGCQADASASNEFREAGAQIWSPRSSDGRAEESASCIGIPRLAFDPTTEYSPLSRQSRKVRNLELEGTPVHLFGTDQPQ